MNSVFGAISTHNGWEKYIDDAYVDKSKYNIYWDRTHSCYVVKCETTIVFWYDPVGFFRSKRQKVIHTQVDIRSAKVACTVDACEEIARNIRREYTQQLDEVKKKYSKKLSVQVASVPVKTIDEWVNRINEVLSGKDTDRELFLLKLLSELTTIKKGK